jgi:hypothetical protein
VALIHRRVSELARQRQLKPPSDGVVAHMLTVERSSTHG